MAGISSRIGKFGIAVQTAKGTAATNPTHVAYFAGAPSLGPVKDTANIALTDSGRDVVQGSTYVNLMSVAGDVPLVAHPEIMALLWGATLGANADAGAGPYTHTATPASDGMWLTCWRMVGNVIYEKYTDVKITSMTFEGGAGAPWTVTLSLLGVKSNFLAADFTGTPLGSSPYMFPEAAGEVKFATVAQRVHALSITVNNNMSGYQADDYSYSDVDPGAREIGFSFSTRFTGATAWPDYRSFFYGSAGGTDQSRVLGTAAAAITITRDASTDMVITIPRLIYGAFNPQPDPGGAPLEIDVDCSVEKPTAGNIITVATRDAAATI